MSNAQILDRLREWRARLVKTSLNPDVLLLWVDVASQCLFLCKTGRVVGRYPVSTARNGTGCAQDSYQTPLGLHYISEKLGQAAPIGAVFKGRQATGELAMIESSDVDTGMDQICSRIIWLSGLEPGVNQGEGVDTHERYIYIHGTNEEGRIGKAVSHGCIRMNNIDVIALFEQVEIGTVVIIE